MCVLFALNDCPCTDAGVVPVGSSKTVKARAASFYDDSNDDELSDISERSHEDDNSDPIVNKIDTSTSTNTVGLNAPKATITDNSHPSATPESLPSPVSMASRAPVVVLARRLTPSDSVDTISSVDSNIESQQNADAFFSPDESLNGTDGSDSQKTPVLSEIRRKPTSEPSSVIVHAASDSSESSCEVESQTEESSQSDDDGDDNDNESHAQKDASKPSVSKDSTLPVLSDKTTLGEPLLCPAW
jgi:hypothetical protein